MSDSRTKQNVHRNQKIVLPASTVAYSSKPLISIIIRSLNSMTGTKRLDRLLDSIFSDYSETEVLLIDSQSTDSTLSVASKYPVRILHCQGNRTDAFLLGIKESIGDFILLMDTDKVLPIGLLNECRMIIKRHFPDGVAIDDEMVSNKQGFIDVAKMHNLEYAAGISDSSKTNIILIKRNLVQSARLPSSLLLGEDYVLINQTLKKDSRIIKASQKTLHFHGSSFQDMTRRTLYYGRNFVWDSKKVGSQAAFVSSISILDIKRLKVLAGHLFNEPELIFPFSIYILTKYFSFTMGYLLRLFGN